MYMELMCLALPGSILMTEDRRSRTPRLDPRASVLCVLNTLCNAYACPLLDVSDSKRMSAAAAKRISCRSAQI